MAPDRRINQLFTQLVAKTSLGLRDLYEIEKAAAGHVDVPGFSLVRVSTGETEGDALSVWSIRKRARRPNTFEVSLTSNKGHDRGESGYGIRVCWTDSTLDRYDPGTGDTGSAVLGLIKMGRGILGYSPYVEFLSLYKTRLLKVDPAASIRVGRDHMELSDL